MDKLKQILRKEYGLNVEYIKAGFNEYATFQECVVWMPVNEDGVWATPIGANVALTPIECGYQITDTFASEAGLENTYLSIAHGLFKQFLAKNPEYATHFYGRQRAKVFAEKIKGLRHISLNEDLNNVGYYLGAIQFIGHKDRERSKSYLNRILKLFDGAYQEHWDEYPVFYDYLLYELVGELVGEVGIEK